MKLYFTELASPVGLLKIICSEKGIVAILWENDSPKRVKLPSVVENSKHPLLKEATKQLKEYFLGSRENFDLPLSPIGTEFQKRVWLGLRKIPFGQTRSYGELAKSIGSPTASRAVGAANGKNPLSIIVPCHRVIGANGSLTGFAGGLKAKRILLELEGIDC